MAHGVTVHKGWCEKFDTVCIHTHTHTNNTLRSRVLIYSLLSLMDYTECSCRVQARVNGICFIHFRVLYCASGNRCPLRRPRDFRQGRRRRRSPSRSAPRSQGGQFNRHLLGPKLLLVMGCVKLGY